MANVVPADYPVPDPLAVSTGIALTSPRVAPLFRSANWIRAHLGARGLVQQSFPKRDGVYEWRDDKAAYGADPVTRWRVPDVAGRTTAECYIYAHTDGAETTHEVKITSVNGGGAAVFTPTATPALLGPVDLDIDASGGYEEIKGWSHGDGATAVRVESVLVRAPVLASPLASGEASDGWIAFDENEAGVKKPLSSARAKRLREDLKALRDVPQVYFQYSALGFTDITAGREGDHMHARTHAVAGPVWPGTQRNSWVITVHARLSNPAGDDRVFVLAAGPDWEHVDPGAAVITVAAGAPKSWYTTTIALRERRRALPLPRGIDSTILSVWPDGTYLQNAIGPRALSRVPATALTTCLVHSVSAWGR